LVEKPQVNASFSDVNSVHPYFMEYMLIRQFRKEEGVGDVSPSSPSPIPPILNFVADELSNVS
jgi:hypothetical protein